MDRRATAPNHVCKQSVKHRIRPLTAFDRAKFAPADFRILIGADAVRSARSEDLERVAAIAKFRHIHVLCLVASLEDEALAAASALSPAKLTEAGSSLALDLANGDGYIVSSKVRALAKYPRDVALPTWWPEQVMAAERISALDRDMHDIVVVSQRAIDTSPHRLDPHLSCTLHQMFRRVTLFQIASGFVEPQPGHRITISADRERRAASLFCSYEHAWQVFGALGVDNDRVTSLFQRLEFLIGAGDQTCIAAFRGPGNDAQDEMLYHLGYFAMLIAGVLEDLAAIITTAFQLEFARITDQTLRPKARSAFVRELRSRRPSLADFLSRDETRRVLGAIFDIRDELQHRIHPRPVSSSVRVAGRTVQLASLVEIPEEAFLALRDAAASQTKWREFSGFRPGFVVVDPESLVIAQTAALTTLFAEIVARFPT